MKLTVTGKNIEITDAIHDHLNQKMEKALKLLQDHADVHVVLATEKHRHFAEITVKTKGFSLNSKDETNDLYLSMDNVLEKIEKQMRKHKDRAKTLKIKRSSEEKGKSQI